MLLYNSEYIRTIPVVIKRTTGIMQNRDSCAAPSGDVYISAYIPRRLGAFTCSLRLFYDFVDKCEHHGGVFSGIENGCDVYTVHLRPEVGLYYYVFEIRCAYGTFTVSNTGGEVYGTLVSSDGVAEKFQLLVYDGAYRPPQGFSTRAMYHIFVDRFFRARRVTPREDAVMLPDWDGGIPEYTELPGQPLENNTFFGGTLYGVCEKLDYLAALGVGVIYLSPVFRAYSNHKYDTGDYLTVDAMFGGIRAFKKLIEQAHSRGMKVILDGVFNHTGDDSLYFNRYGKYRGSGAYNSRASKYYEWYRFTDYPDEYDSWWGIKILPSLNHKSKALREFLCGEDGVVRRYLRLGADGWRLDVADELPCDLIEDIKTAAEAEKPGSLILGEVWEDASNKISYGTRRSYFMGHQLDSVMNYPLKDAIISYIKSSDASAFARAYRVQLLHYPASVLLNLMNFLGTHDTERILTVLGGKPAGSRTGSELAALRMTDAEYADGVVKLRLAFGLLCFCPGIPCVYYGDEVGMQGYRDPFNRFPYPWGREDTELRRFFSDIIGVRTVHVPLHAGSCEIVRSHGGVLVMKRFCGGDEIYGVFNACAHVSVVTLDGAYTSVISGCEYVNTARLQPYSFEYIVKEDKLHDKADK